MSDGAVSEVQKLVLRPVVRLAGQDRYATAASVATHAVRCYWLDTAQVLVATGARFPDALGGGAAAGKRGCVMVLTRSTVLPVATRDYLARNKASIVAVRILGGVDAVSQDVKSAIESVLK
ncbi:MAG: cell wall-binding repeat-containing protein [Coriobacteriia bacterium]|nr:cell wall-binding repeat-containing protein [Coriobacteriia bacterium]